MPTISKLPQYSVTKRGRILYTGDETETQNFLLSCSNQEQLKVKGPDNYQMLARTWIRVSHNRKK